MNTQEDHVRQPRSHRAPKSKAIVSSDEDEGERKESSGSPSSTNAHPTSQHDEILSALERDGFVLLNYDEFHQRKPELKPLLRQQIATRIKLEEVSG